MEKPQYSRWLQLWPQLVIKNGVLHRYYTKPISKEKTIIPIAPSSLRSSYLQQFHDSPSAGHLGFTKTLSRLKDNVCWVGMAADTQVYCDLCDVCNRSKPPHPPQVPLVNTPIGKKWWVLMYLKCPFHVRVASIFLSFKIILPNGQLLYPSRIRWLT